MSLRYKLSQTFDPLFQRLPKLAHSLGVPIARIGLEINPPFIHLVNIEHVEHGFLVTAMRSIRMQGEEADEIAVQVQQAIQEEGIQTKLVSLVVEHVDHRSQNDVHLFELPPMPQRERKAMVLRQLQKHSNVSLENIYYEVAHFAAKRKGALEKVLVATVTKSHLDFGLEVIYRAGLKPAEVVSAPLALMNNLGIARDYLNQEIVALVHLTAGKIILVVTDHGQIVFTRETELNSASALEDDAHEATAMVDQDQLVNFNLRQIDFDEQTFGATEATEITDLEHENTATLSDPVPADPLSSMLQHELSRTFSYFTQHYRDVSISMAMLSGNAELIRPAKDLIQQQLQVRSFPFHKIIDSNVQVMAEDPHLARSLINKMPLAIGSTLNRLSKVGINLLPREVRERRYNGVNRLCLLGITLFLVAGLAWSKLYVTRQIKQRNVHVVAMKSDIEKMKPRADKYLSAKQKIDAVQKYTVLLKRMELYRIRWPQLFLLLSQGTPDDVVFDRLNAKLEDGAYHFILNGYLTGKDAIDAQTKLEAFYEQKFTQLPLLKDIKLLPITIDQGASSDNEVNKRINFNIRFNIVNPVPWEY